jgi:hypothetical protein
MSGEQRSINTTLKAKSRRLPILAHMVVVCLYYLLPACGCRCCQRHTSIAAAITAGNHTASKTVSVVGAIDSAGAPYLIAIDNTVESAKTLRISSIIRSALQLEKIVKASAMLRSNKQFLVIHCKCVLCLTAVFN